MCTAVCFVRLAIGIEYNGNTKTIHLATWRTLHSELFQM